MRMALRGLAVLTDECDAALDAYLKAASAVDSALARGELPTDAQRIAEADALVQLRAARAQYVTSFIAEARRLAAAAAEASAVHTRTTQKLRVARPLN
jgi:hypothetical protein